VFRLVPLKGDRAAGEGRLVSLAPATARAPATYLRARRSHKLADSDWVWLGTRSRGRFGNTGIRKMLLRRAEEADAARAGLLPSRRGLDVDDPSGGGRRSGKIHATVRIEHDKSSLGGLPEGPGQRVPVSISASVTSYFFGQVRMMPCSLHRPIQWRTATGSRSTATTPLKS
jgi:hypothetical protein